MLRLFVALVLVFPSAAETFAQDLWRVRIDAEQPQSVASLLEAKGFDVLEGTVGASSLELVVTAGERAELRRLGHRSVVLEKGRPFRDIQAERAGVEAVPPGYPDPEQIVAELEACESAFPAICRVVDLTEEFNMAPTFEGRHMMAVKISSNVDQEEDEPAFLMVGNHHAREIVPTVIALYAIDRFTSQYGVDPRITELVDSYEIWIAPTWNPDGYNEVFTENNLWRKNMRVMPGGVGVDLNRNYPIRWASACGGSTSRKSDTYRGPWPASEAETGTMNALSADRNFAKVLDYHSSGREVLYGYSCHRHPFEEFMKREARALSLASGYGGAVRAPSAEGEHQEWQWARHGSYAFLTETHTEFQPGYQSALEEAALVFPGALWLLERPIPLSGHVIDADTGEPVDALITYSGVWFSNRERNRSSGPYGRYHAFLPPGSYTVEFSSDRYVGQSHSVVIEEGSELVLEISLTPIPSSADVESASVAPVASARSGG